MRLSLLRSALLTLSLLLPLTACETTNSISDSISNLKFPEFFKGHALESEEEQDGFAAANECPSVLPARDLDRIIQFTNPENPEESARISSATISSVHSRCKLTPAGAEVKIYLSFSGDLGPAAHAELGAAPSLSHPYFVAVTDGSGDIVAKDVFALTLAYASGETHLEQEETLTQILPAPIGGGSLRDYTILAGFQLSSEELDYNRRTPRITADSK